MLHFKRVCGRCKQASSINCMSLLNRRVELYSKCGRKAPLKARNLIEFCLSGLFQRGKWSGTARIIPRLYIIVETGFFV